ncbi:MAG: sensor histidine kinase [Ekhidna sp.]
MKHPLLNGIGFKFYLLVWVFIALIHGSILYFHYSFSLEIAALESLTFNLIFSTIASGFWYIVSFNNQKRDELSVITTHLGAAIFIVSSWLFIANHLLKLIFNECNSYLQFLEESYIGRLIIGMMFYSITVLILYLIKYYRDTQERLSRELELQNMLKDSELRMLKSQINPHFIFNSLNSISALTISKGELAREMVIKLSDFLRYSLGKGNEEMNSLKDEIKNVSLYLDIEKVRFGERLQFENKVNEECLDVKVPNLILQPIFENAIKFGVYDSTELVTIRLKCESKNDLLHISINNNFDKDAVPSKGEGIGLESVRKRLNLVFDRSDLLEIHKEETEFTVIVKIPLRQEEDE